MDSHLVTGIIGAASALVGSLIGGLFALWAGSRAHKRQLELQLIQFRGQMEMKARELMFGVYKSKNEEFNREIKELGAVIGKLGMVMHLSDVEEREKMEVMMAFVGTVRSLTDPIIERIGEIENELEDAGLLKQSKSQLEFVKRHLTSDLARITPQEVESSYQNLARALTYVTALQNNLVEKSSLELFGEYLPKKSLRKAVSVNAPRRAD
jgi:hypothetical protein